MIKIREAVIDDAGAIAQLGRLTFSETFGHLFRDKNDLEEYFEKTFSTEKIRNSFTKPNNIFWISHVNDQPVGYAKLKIRSASAFIQSEKTAQLQKIYVLKDFHSLKIGLELQKKLIAKAKEEGNESIWLSVLHTNDKAIRFYERNGFAEIGKHEFQIGKENFTFIVMSKSLIRY